MDEHLDLSDRMPEPTYKPLGDGEVHDREPVTRATWGAQGWHHDQTEPTGLNRAGRIAAMVCSAAIVILAVVVFLTTT